MGDPDGKDDIVWYDFSNFPGLGGYPGNGGNAVFAGHVDYHPHFLAVFWYLRDARAGDVIDYYTAAGKHLQYTVDWNKNAGPDDDFSVYVSQTGSDLMTIITCDGVFNPATGHYDFRSVVRAHRTT
jgi:LPXTG-site transpeptidase (sortase) family protein